MSFESPTTRNVQQLTGSALLLLSIPFISASLSPSINYPFPSSLGHSFELPGSVYSFSAAIYRENIQFNIVEQFAVSLLANTKDLAPSIANALNEDFWQLYESH